VGIESHDGPWLDTYEKKLTVACVLKKASVLRTISFTQEAHKTGQLSPASSTRPIFSGRRPRPYYVSQRRDIKRNPRGGDGSRLGCACKGVSTREEGVSSALIIRKLQIQKVESIGGLVTLLYRKKICFTANT
jgi:hypothetical protein